MIAKLRNAITWRMDQIHQLTLKFNWELKRLADFSKKEMVKSVSVVVVGRNDNYGGDFKSRLQTTLDWNLLHLPDPELIYVEWNRIKERPSDCEWISKRYVNSKCYIVSKEVHDSLSTNPNIPMLEYLAKNLGIRKATNKWILLVNADVYIDPADFKKELKLSGRHVYGTYLCNVNWNGAPIKADNYKKNITFIGHPYSDMTAVVGNFILTHKENWLLSQGYDESLADVRMGMDDDGLRQLLSKGIKPMILGHHYHLDHSETASKGTNPTHGNTAKLLNRKYPYKNKENWGLSNYPLKNVANNIWELQKI